MPHNRLRYLTSAIKKGLSYSPIVGIFGSRQVGKTHLLTSLSAEYVSLDQRNSLATLEADETQFISNRGAPFGIDESQMAPTLFPALKEYVRLHPKKGAFLLTGSVRYLSRKSIRESLTGRIALFELLPLTLAETEDRPIPHFIRDFHLTKKIEPQLSVISTHLEKLRSPLSYLETGGLPGICFFRDPTIRSQKFESHLDTVLSRDIKLIFPTTLEPKILIGLLIELAKSQGDVIDYSKLSRKTRISRPTLAKVFNAFESLYLIRRLRTFGGPPKDICYFEDQGLASHLLNTQVDRRFQLRRLLYANLRQEVHYNDSAENYQFTTWRSTPSHQIDFVVQSKTAVTGIQVLQESTPTREELKTGAIFSKSFPGAKMLYVSLDSAPNVLHHQAACMPAKALL